MFQDIHFKMTKLLAKQLKRFDQPIWHTSPHRSIEALLRQMELIKPYSNNQEYILKIEKRLIFLQSSYNNQDFKSIDLNLSVIQAKKVLEKFTLS